MALRNQGLPARSLEELAEKAFGLMILGDDRAVHAVYIAGALVHQLGT
jgi:guanine deaminase